MLSNVAIIGAGLSGLALALALHQQSIACTVYEARPDAPLNIGGAIMLSPNALRILDQLGVYSRIQNQGFNFRKLEYRNATTTPPSLTDVQEFGNREKYGYDGLRIYRTELIETLLTMIDEAGIEIQYGKKFSHVLEETVDGISWQFEDGEMGSASLLIGADGIHSTVRKYLYPDLVPKFVGVAGVSVPVPTAQLKVPEDVHLPVTYTHPSAGGFVIAPQKADGSEVFIGKQRRIAGEPSRAEWNAIAADKATLLKFLQEGNESLPEIVRNAVSQISPERITLWPFHVVPRLDRWTSDQYRHVIILGDAAHAIPPSAGQGINQAFEDVYMLSKLLATVTPSNPTKSTKAKGRSGTTSDALAFWQEYRQARVDEVLKLNKQIDLRRMPQEQEQGVARSDLEIEWLYNADFDGVINDWLAGRKAKESAKKTCPIERLLRWRS